MSCDPIGERGGLNLYGMVNNDPVGNWDYLGLRLPVPLTGETFDYLGIKGEGMLSAHYYVYRNEKFYKNIADRGRKRGLTGKALSEYVDWARQVYPPKGVGPDSDSGASLKVKELINEINRITDDGVGNCKGKKQYYVISVIRNKKGELASGSTSTIYDSLQNLDPDNVYAFGHGAIRRNSDLSLASNDLRGTFQWTKDNLKTHHSSVNLGDNIPMYLLERAGFNPNNISSCYLSPPVRNEYPGGVSRITTSAVDMPRVYKILEAYKKQAISAREQCKCAKEIKVHIHEGLNHL